MTRFKRVQFVAGGLVAVLAVAGCHGRGARSEGDRSATSKVRKVACIYDLKPWLNLDRAGDRDPEGIHYRVFLDPGNGRGVIRDGTFHIEMYKIARDASGEKERTLVSDWRYPTTTFQQVSGKFVGRGYHLRLRWADKDLAGNEIEVVTRYEDPSGRVVGAGTKRLRVPKYSSY